MGAREDNATNTAAIFERVGIEFVRQEIQVIGIIGYRKSDNKTIFVAPPNKEGILDYEDTLDYLRECIKQISKMQEQSSTPKNG